MSKRLFVPQIVMQGWSPLLQYDSEQEVWIESGISWEEVERICTYVWDKGFDGYPEVVLDTEAGGKTVDLEQVQKRNLAKSYRGIWAIQFRKTVGNFSNIMTLTSAGNSLQTRTDIPRSQFESISDGNQRLRQQLDEVTKKFGLKWGEYTLEPMFFRMDPISLDSVKRFISDVESLSEEFPICLFFASSKA